MTDNLKDAALRQAAACARAQYPGQEKRLDKGLVLALNHAVTWHPDNTAMVQSESNADVVYQVRGARCDCPDWRNAPDGNCKHRWAAYFTRLAALAMQPR